MTRHARSGIFDVHVHYTGDLAEAERAIGRWQEAEIARAVVFGWTEDDGSRTPLDRVAALAERHPDFVVPFGYLNPGQHDHLADAREAAARGFTGLKLIFPARSYDDDEYFPLYEFAASKGLVCLFHTGIVVGTAREGSTYEYQRRWRVSSNYMRPACLDRIARTFPEMTIIGAHLGAGAWYEEATEVMVWNGNVYFDLSIGQLHYERKDALEGEERRAIRPRIQELYDTGQLDLTRVLFGSDAFFGREGASPQWALSTLEFELDAIGATQAERQAVRWATAARLLGGG